MASILAPKNIMIAILLGLVFYFVILPNIHPKGDTHVDVGYVLASGEFVPIEGEATLFMGESFQLYTNVNKTTPVTALRWNLHVNPKTDFTDVNFVDITYTMDGWWRYQYPGTDWNFAQELDVTGLPSSGSTSLVPNESALVRTFDVTLDDWSAAFDEQALWYRVDFVVTGSLTRQGTTYTDTSTAGADIVAFWSPEGEAGPLTITTNVAGSPFNITD